MKIIDGKGAIMGRLASFAAKEALKGEEIVVLNCKEVIITGNKRYFENKQLEMKGRIGSGQKGPKISKLPHLIVKRAIRGMFPTHRHGRGKIAFKKIKCYATVPKEFEGKNIISMDKKFKGKSLTIKELSK